MKIALAQINPTMGDIAGNAARVTSRIDDAAAAGADLVVFPEQTLLGYPARDLFQRREVLVANTAALNCIASHNPKIAILIGFSELNDAPVGRLAYNAAALLHNGRIIHTWRKQLLPTYDIFDDARYFEPGGPQSVIEFQGRRLGVAICEDLLAEQLFAKPLYANDPVADAHRNRADLLINITASPYHHDKHTTWRLGKIAAQARANQLTVVNVNQVGGNDEILFDGASCVVGPDGGLIAQAASFREDLLIVDLEKPAIARRETTPTGMSGLRQALALGIHDYLRKCGLSKVVVGLSGGIDSALVAALAVEALGAAAVHGVAMPSRFSSDHSLTDARDLARNLGIHLSVIEIEKMHAAAEQTLSPHFAGRPADVTEENLQARIRGQILMALSNKFGCMVLTTGNKSELATGYCTLYGDMCGGLAVLGDVLKTTVYKLARHINEHAGRELIPRSTLEKVPSAELKPNQTDQDTLPPYDVLDAIIARYEEQWQSADEIIAAGFDRPLVERVIRMINASEYKRQQAAPVLRVSPRAFGYGRRMPIAARTAPR